MNIENQKLYSETKEEAKKKFKKWPSIYASSWLVSEYKRRGGTYTKKKKPSYKSGLKRWYRELWIDTCQLPKIVPCGRPKASIKNWKKEYPYCRPLYRVTKKTPTTANEVTTNTLKKMCAQKKKNPMKKQKTIKKSNSKGISRGTARRSR